MSMRFQNQVWRHLVRMEYKISCGNMDEHCVIQDLHKGRSGRPKDVRTVKNVEKVSEILVNSNGRKRKSIRFFFSIMGISKTTTHRIMKEDLKEFPYKPTVSQKISDVQRENRLVFC